MGIELDHVLLAHGGGGELTVRLLREHVLGPLANDALDSLDDAAVLGGFAGSVVFTTDSYVVTPIAFPGGDIGRLAVAGTVNDLAVMGAEPVAISLGLILEEGLSLAVLDGIVASIAATAREANVAVVTGDTKVIERRSGDAAAGMLINTAGVGRPRADVSLGLDQVAPGDAVLINGRIADHGLAVMSVRKGLSFETTLVSDVAPLAGLIATLLDAGVTVKFLRDPTRGGIAGVLADISEATGHSVEIDEAAVPMSATARHVAELLGLDPLTIANEGKVVAVIAGDQADRALAALRSHPLGREAARIGRVTDATPALVELCTRVGGRRIVQRPYGEDLPRIC